MVHLVVRLCTIAKNNRDELPGILVIHSDVGRKLKGLMLLFFKLKNNIIMCFVSQDFGSFIISHCQPVLVHGFHIDGYNF